MWNHPYLQGQQVGDQDPRLHQLLHFQKEQLFCTVGALPHAFFYITYNPKIRKFFSSLHTFFYQVFSELLFPSHKGTYYGLDSEPFFFFLRFFFWLFWWDWEQDLYFPDKGSTAPYMIREYRVETTGIKDEGSLQWYGTG